MLSGKNYTVSFDEKGSYIVLNRYWDSYGLQQTIDKIMQAMVNATSRSMQVNDIFMSNKTYESLMKTLNPTKKKSRRKKKS